jgi:carboxymethylenebutenolidase
MFVQPGVGPSHRRIQDPIPVDRPPEGFPPMSNPTQQIEIVGPSGPISIHFATPRTIGPAPAILIGHEGLGLTNHVKHLAERLAAEGYVVAIPDLYTRQREFREFTEAEVARHIAYARLPNPAPALDALPEPERQTAQRVVRWFKTRDIAGQLPDLAAAFEWLSFRPEVAPGSVGALGFSMGAGLVGQILSRPGVAAAVIFYGSLPAPEAAQRVSSPLQGHFAEDDTFVNLGLVPFAQALAERGIEFGWTKHPGTRHGFYNETRDTYHPQAASQAWKSTLSFFRRHLPVQTA